MAVAGAAGSGAAGGELVAAFSAATQSASIDDKSSPWPAPAQLCCRRPDQHKRQLRSPWDRRLLLASLLEHAKA